VGHASEVSRWLVLLCRVLTEPLNRLHFDGFEGFVGPYLDGQAGTSIWAMEHGRERNGWVRPPYRVSLIPFSVALLQQASSSLTTSSSTTSWQPSKPLFYGPQKPFAMALRPADYVENRARL
jgi:hypothetical protein